MHSVAPTSLYNGIELCQGINHGGCYFSYSQQTSASQPFHECTHLFRCFSLGVNLLKDKRTPSSPMNQRRKICSTVPTPRIVLDAKRGDIGSTSEAYATSAFSTLACDSITASPYLGLFGGLGGLVGDRQERGHAFFWGDELF